MSEKKKYRALVNGELGYKWAHSLSKALFLFSQEAKSKVGRSKITDIGVETTPNHYSRILSNPNGITESKNGREPVFS